MKKIIYYIIALISAVTISPATSFAQTAPTLGTAAKFALFTSAGEFANTGNTTVIGDIGYFTGSRSGDAVTVTGSTYFGGADAGFVATDVASAYAQLTSTALNPCTTTLTSPIGAGATLPSGVYCVTTAAVLTGQLTLDGGDNPDAIFIIKVKGALSVDATTNILLTGGASLQNVYWQADGAFNLAAGANFKGTIINGGAITLAPGATISGRALTTAGKISLNANDVSNAEVALPVTLVSFTVRTAENRTALLNWATTDEVNSARFEIEHSVNGKKWTQRAVVSAKGESRERINYSFNDESPSEGINLYRLKMIDLDETFAYSRIRSVNIESGRQTVLYPNPTSDQLNLKVQDLNKISRVQFTDISGKLVLDQRKTSSVDIADKFSLAYFPAGVYVVKVTNTDGSFDRVKIVKR